MSFKWLDNQVAGEVSMQVSNPIQYGGSNLTYFSPITSTNVAIRPKLFDF